MTPRRLLVLMVLAAVLAGGGTAWLVSASNDDEQVAAPVTTVPLEVEVRTSDTTTTSTTAPTGATAPPSLRAAVATTTTAPTTVPPFPGTNCGYVDKKYPAAPVYVVKGDMSCDEVSFALEAYEDPGYQGPTSFFECVDSDPTTASNYLVGCGTKGETGPVLERSRSFAVAQPS